MLVLLRRLGSRTCSHTGSWEVPFAIDRLLGGRKGRRGYDDFSTTLFLETVLFQSKAHIIRHTTVGTTTSPLLKCLPNACSLSPQLQQSPFCPLHLRQNAHQSAALPNLPISRHPHLPSPGAAPACSQPHLANSPGGPSIELLCCPFPCDKGSGYRVIDWFSCRQMGPSWAPTETPGCMG